MGSTLLWRLVSFDSPWRKGIRGGGNPGEGGGGRSDATRATLADVFTLP